MSDASVEGSVNATRDFDIRQRKGWTAIFAAAKQMIYLR